jgi:cholesterol transport system auxiliary component
MLWLTGCTPQILQSEPGPDNIYVLDVTIEPRPQVRPADKVVLVNSPQAQSGFDTRRIAYTRTPLSLDYYTRSVWADNPARMLDSLIVRALEKSGAFRAVVSASTSVVADVRLDTTIVRLQHEFYQQPSQVRLTVRAKLLDLGTREVLATRLFEVIEPAPSEDARGGVQAANRAVGRMLEDLTDFVIANIPD